MKSLWRDIFSDRLTRLSATVFVIIVALILFNTLSNVSDTHPMVGVFAFMLVPILVVVGGVVFLAAIFRLRD